MDDQNSIDLELVRRFKEGDQAAFDQLFNRYKEKIVHVAMRYTGGDLQASEDIAHEVFIEVYEHIHKFRGEGRFFAYLYGITFYKAKKYLRSKISRREISLSREDDEHEETERDIPSGEESARRSLDKKELERILQKALDQLPEIGRQVFVLTQVEGLSYGEAAETLGIAAGTVGAHLYQARKKLREILPLDKLELFLFSIFRIAQEGLFHMSILIENSKLLLKRPSSLVLSFYLDNESSHWQNEKLEPLLKAIPEFQDEYQDFQKIGALYQTLGRPALAPDFQIRFQRKLRGRLEEGLEPAGWRGLAIPRPAALVLTALVVSFSVWMAYPLLERPYLSAAGLEGRVEQYNVKTASWAEVRKNTRLRKHDKLRVAKDASLDLSFQNKFYVRVKENSEIEIRQLTRPGQKGEVVLNQDYGKILIGLGKDFKGSQFSVVTPHAYVYAFGTEFLVDVDRPNTKTRIMVLEGTVHVSDILKTTSETVSPQTERVVTPFAIEASKPLTVEREPEINELSALPTPGKEKKASGFLEENFSLMLIPGPGRVEDFLENPRIFTQNDYPLLTQKVLETRKLVRQAAEENRPELYEQAIGILKVFSETYADPGGRFKPHINAFSGALYYLIGKYEEALSRFEQVARYPEREWQGIGRTARGIIYEKHLHQIENARKEYALAMRESPDSPESIEAKTRLSKLSK